MLSFPTNKVRALRDVVAHLAGAVPDTLDTTARDLVFEAGKLRLWRVRSSQRRVSTPVLIFPPLMVRPFIYDLSPSLSLLRTMRDSGFDVFLADFGVPDRGDRHVRLDDYVLHHVPSCVDRALEASGADQIAIVGYCMGGLFGLMHVGTFQDPRVEALVTIGSPVNFSRVGVVYAAARLSAPVMDSIIDIMGNIPGSVSSLAFKLLTGRHVLLNVVHVLEHLDDREALESFRAINYWINNLIPYPQEAFRQMFKEVVVGNKLIQGELHFDQRRCDLNAISCAVLSFAGQDDQIVRPDSIREIMEVTSSRDNKLVVAPGGHVGVMAGSSAPERVWRPMLSWLHDRLDQRSAHL